jgi:hypothetical protein
MLPLGSVAQPYTMSSTASMPVPHQPVPHPAQSSDLPHIEVYLRRELQIPNHLPVSLSSIPDPRDGSRPYPSNHNLVALAIYTSPHKKLTLQQIYDVLVNRFWYFKENTGSWRVSDKCGLRFLGIADELLYRNPFDISYPCRVSSSSVLAL